MHKHLTTSYIRRYIAGLKPDQPFTTRDFLSYGSRGAIDIALWRMVKEGIIHRLARGVFVRQAINLPPQAVAEAKAKGFGKQIAIHGAVLAGDLAGRTSEKHIFAVDGSSSSFRYGQITIYFRKTCARKIALKDSMAGKAIRALWYEGMQAINPMQMRQIRREWGRLEKLEAEQQFPRWMPAWLTKQFAPAEPKWHLPLSA